MLDPAPRTENDADVLPDLALVPDSSVSSVLPLYRGALELERLTLNDALMIRDVLQVAGLHESAGVALHGLLIALCASRNQGSLCLDVDCDSVVRAVRESTGHSLSASDAENLVETVESGGYGALISFDGQVCSPIVFSRQGKHLYFQRYFEHEQRLTRSLLSLVERASVSGRLSPERARALSLSSSRYAGFSGEQKRLHDEQLRGVYLALRTPFTIISGGPGTGKTTLVASILRALVSAGYSAERIFLVAPTGRAGQRLGEAIQASLDLAGDALDGAVREGLRGMSGRTIHRLLRYNPSRNAYTYGPGNPLPADVLICDEVSMVDVVLMDRLLSALPSDVKVVFLGDKDQLPSVEAGAVLGDLIPRNPVPLYSTSMRDELAALTPGGPPLSSAERQTALTDRIVLLTTSHRAKGPVVASAAAFNRGDPDALGSLRVVHPGAVRFSGVFSADRHEARGVMGIDWGAFTDECVRIDLGSGGANALRQLVLSWTDWLFQGTEGTPSLSDLLSVDLMESDLPSTGVPAQPARRLLALFELWERGQILTLTRRGIFGCEGLNRFLAEFWRDRLDPWRPRGSRVFRGCPIMITRNDYHRGLFNGDSGIVVRTTDSERYFVLFRRGSAITAFPMGAIPDHDLCFAMTVHKSQGSEYGNVLMVMPQKPDHPLLTREIVYTGMTRTKGNAFLAASEGVLRAAVSRRIERHSGIDLWAGEGKGE